ncbi:MAG: hypothetical protein H6839_00055 [Planctomycetes bacterium]|nr:hypothetical protein [Planctomycetota bacterium]
MGRNRILAPVILLVAVGALAGAIWLANRGATGVLPTVAELDNASQRAGDDSPLALPGAEPGDETPAPERTPDPTPATKTPAPTQPELHVPDYGPDIRRGGGFVDLELFESTGARMDVTGFEASLQRAVGDCWVEEVAIVDTRSNVVRCVGLGLAGLEPTGLEPGSYEVTLTSERKGCVRYRFEVARNERRTDRVELPVWTRTVSFTFVKPDGSPVGWIQEFPKVITTSKALEPVGHPRVGPLEFRRPPTEPDEELPPGRGGGGFGGSGWYEMHRPGKDPPRYATDDGRWWVTVLAGCDNQVCFHFDEKLWGQQSYSFTDDFTVTDAQTVVLETVEGFDEKVFEPGHVATGYEPGNRGILSPVPPARVDFRGDPVPRGRTRLLLTINAPCDVSVRLNWTKEKRTDRLKFEDGVHWIEFDDRPTCDVTFDLPGNLNTLTDSLDVSPGGLIHLERTLPVRVLELGGTGLTPTLEAFAHSWCVKLDRKQGDPETFAFQNRDGRWQGLALHTEPGEFTACHITLSGAHDYYVPPPQTRTTITDKGNSYFYSRRRSYGFSSSTPSTPLAISESLDAPEDPLKAFALRPDWRDVLVLRAVDEHGAGLPSIRGLVLAYKDDEIAGQVRERCAAQPTHPTIERADAFEYTATLEAQEAGAQPDALRRLIGEASYNAFETNAQRLWFARHGAWYHTRTHLSGDDQGYVVQPATGLQAGELYVLYLWSRSRDDLRPDRRIVFKAADGVTDLGAIHLPTYSD